MPTLEELARRVESFGAPSTGDEDLARRVESFGQAAPEASWWNSAERKALFPHPEIVGAAGRQIERGGEAVMALPGQVAGIPGMAADFGQMLLDTGTTKARMVGHALGVPGVSEPTEAEKSQLLNRAVNQTLLAGSTAAGRLAAKPAEAGLKALTRGGRSSAHARSALGLPAAGPRSAVGDIASELGSRAASAATGATLAEAAPGDIPHASEGFIGGLAGAFGLTQSSDWILRQHPQLARWATSAPRGTVGAGLGLALRLGLIAAKERGLPFVADLERWLLGGEEKQ